MRFIMPGKKIIWRIVFLLLTGLLIFLARYIYLAAPVISAYGAKTACSAVYLQHRQIQTVIEEELSDFPFSVATYTLNEHDASVTGSVLGFAKRKAIYREGLGATLVNDSSETQIRAQQFRLPAKPVKYTDSIPWPNGDLLPDTLPGNIDSIALHSILQRALNEGGMAKSQHTTALAVVYDGQLIAEKYAAGYNKHTLMPGWSVAKSITGALTGILVKEGKLNVNAPAPVAEWKGTSRESITIKQLLQQTSGLDYEENYRKAGSATSMLFKKGNAAAYAAQLPLKYAPGSVFNYSSGNSNIISRIIRQATGEKNYHAFPYETLFYKTGMYSMVLEPDASGTYVGSSFCYATARDYARFGLLYYNNGIWDNERILPEDWVKATVQPPAANTLQHYGYQFWLNGFNKNDPLQRWYADVPADMYFADGFGGQDIYIIPSKQLIVVRLGLHVTDENRLLREIISTIQ
ncbi:serine hydrolase [Agriterribacter sp.]|uniref:serine hydrolase domain-containing protein n=1 Tax=Agriterribacter sp. TaxID=2821509 RepID=UPI002CC75B7A|nr:serine hydrolase [Agriterribacter sp.]HRO45429.1 serine hydrolase [Agriterribacter sp.]HRQ19137.1 serine hydrolase [Agriterribacter sp.]